jgi:hypothetical protein
MAKTKDYEPVVFEDSRGNIISNDPVFLARQTLAAAGLADDAPKAQPKKAVKKPAVAPTPEPEAIADEEELSDDETDDEAEADEEVEEEVEEDEEAEEVEVRDYSELAGPELKALATQRGVDTTGMKKASEVRAALIEADALEAEADITEE